MRGGALLPSAFSPGVSLALVWLPACPWCPSSSASYLHCVPAVLASCLHPSRHPPTLPAPCLPPARHLRALCVLPTLLALCRPPARHPVCPVSSSSLAPYLHCVSFMPCQPCVSLLPRALPAPCLPPSARSLSATSARPAAPRSPCQTRVLGLCSPGFTGRARFCPELLVARPRRSIPGLKSLELRFCFDSKFTVCDAFLKFCLVVENQACTNHFLFSNASQRKQNKTTK